MVGRQVSLLIQKLLESVILYRSRLRRVETTKISRTDLWSHKTNPSAHKGSLDLFATQIAPELEDFFQQIAP